MSSEKNIVFFKMKKKLSAKLDLVIASTLKI